MNPLDQLADIHLPAPIGIWPFAWGWWLLLVLIVAAIAVATYLIMSAIKKNSYRKQALRELENLYKENLDSPQVFIQGVNQILHRCALHQVNFSNLSLTGEAWLNWLDEQLKPGSKAKRNQQEFYQGPGHILMNGPYQHNLNMSAADRDALYQLAIRWIKKHQFTHKHWEAANV